MKDNNPRGRRKLFLLKIDLPALLAVILFAGMIFIYLIPGFEKVMMDRKRNLIHEMTASVYSLLEHYHEMETGGSLARAEAQEQASASISAIRYGPDLKDYFWVTDMHPSMVAHPYRPDLNGQDLTGVLDSRGKAIFVDFVRAVADGGESYVEYMWQWNDDSTRVVPKLSYVRLFEPWGWVIGTGIYIEDVRSEIRKMEIKTLAISGIFGLVIFALLLAIARQSHEIEQKRSSAVEELHRSRELYRTLAEAASEGVLVWSRQGLQANKTLLSWIGYTEEELQNKSLSEILITEGAIDSDDPEKVYEDLKSRMFIECMLKSGNGRLIDCHADLSRIRLGDLKAVLVVSRPATTMASAAGLNMPGVLLDNAGTGFFRMTYGKKPKFIQASAAVMDILGYSDLRELQQLNFENLFADHAQFESIITALNTEPGILNREVLIRRKNGTTRWILLSMQIFNGGPDETWYDGSLEHLAASQLVSGLSVPGLDSFCPGYIGDAPVTAIMKVPVTIHEHASLARASSLMRENDTGLIVVTKSTGEPVGVVEAGAAGLAMIEGARAETEVFRLMQSPPHQIGDASTVNDAIKKIRNSPFGYLLVMTADNRLAGVITNREIAYASSLTPGLILSDIGSAGTTASLKKIFQSVRQTSLALLQSREDPYSLCLFISSVADAICKRVIEICIEEASTPPCRFAFFLTGSAGRMEQTLLTDQDNAFIIENLDGDQLPTALNYFRTMGAKINEMLDRIGFRLCKGKNMAGNPKWCQPVDRWKEYFSEWIKTPGPGEILDISIFFDFRFCYGDATLVSGLREFVKTNLLTSDIFFYHMSMALKQFAPSHGLLSDERSDIKRIIMPLTGVVRLYALKYGLNGLSTTERLLELHAGKYIDHDLLRDALRAWKDLMYIRLQNQAESVSAGKEPDNMIDFNVRSAAMKPVASTAIDTINELMLKAGNEFHTVTI